MSQTQILLIVAALVVIAVFFWRSKREAKKILNKEKFDRPSTDVLMEGGLKKDPHFDEIRAAMQKKSPYWEGTYKACNIPFTDFQIRYQPEQIRIVDGKRILEDTAFLCRKDNDHFLILPSIYEKLDLDDWLLAHLFFYDKDGKRYIGVELSEVD